MHQHEFAAVKHKLQTVVIVLAWNCSCLTYCQVCRLLWSLAVTETFLLYLHLPTGTNCHISNLLLLLLATGTFLCCSCVNNLEPSLVLQCRSLSSCDSTYRCGTDQNCHCNKAMQLHSLCQTSWHKSGSLGRMRCHSDIGTGNLVPVCESIY
jgi:hypothetical protein